MPAHWPVVLLKLGDAVAVTERTPSPLPATKVTFQVAVGPLAVCRPVCAPVICRQRVSLVVCTVRVTRPPDFTYSTSPTKAVLFVPEKDADVTVAAEAEGVAIPMRATLARAVAT